MSDEELRQARDEVNQALAKARVSQQRASRLTREWNESRVANNFRNMIRALTAEGHKT